MHSAHCSRLHHGEAEQGNAMYTRQKSNRPKMCKKENIRTLGVTLWRRNAQGKNTINRVVLIFFCVVTHPIFSLNNFAFCLCANMLAVSVISSTLYIVFFLSLSIFIDRKLLNLWPLVEQIKKRPRTTQIKPITQFYHNINFELWWQRV